MTQYATLFLDVAAHSERYNAAGLPAVAQKQRESESEIEIEIEQLQQRSEPAGLRFSACVIFHTRTDNTGLPLHIGRLCCATLPFALALAPSVFFLIVF